MLPFKKQRKMDEGSGDNSQVIPALIKEASSTEKESLASIQADISKLRLEAPDQDEIKGETERALEDDYDDDSTSDDSYIEPICSYPYGYIKRQTIYTCLTCNDPTKPDWIPAGVCIGCRYACHQGHELISLETRRNFKCDCGNKKFPEGSPCALYPNKEENNEKNVYNDNYKGTFCSCHCKEAECDADDPLYQCVVCEDWYHTSHCNAKTEGIEKNYTDLVCGHCTAKLDFLRYYDPYDPNAIVDEQAINEMMKYSEIDSDEDEKDTEEQSKFTDACKLESLTMKEPYQTGQLWTLGWRGKLCRCSKCKEMYSSLNVSFLLDKDDETRRYFSEEDDEDTQEKICTLVRKFEEWLFQMDPKERTDLFNLEPDAVKEKMREYFTQTKKEGEADFAFDDHLLDQLFDSFAEFILDADGGADYLEDVDALEKVFGDVQMMKGAAIEASGNDGNLEDENEKPSDNFV